MITNYDPPGFAGNSENDAVHMATPTKEMVDWSDVLDASIEIDKKTVSEMGCCDRELVALIKTGQRQKACRVCGKKVVAKLK